MTPRYVELHARSAFSFLRGSAQPEQLAECAAELKIPAMALCDRDGVYGAPRFYGATKETKGAVRPIVGSELTLDDGTVLPVLVASRTGYQNLCRLITRAKLRGTKTDAPIRWSEIAEFSEGLIALTGDEEGPLRPLLERDDRAAAETCVRRLRQTFGEGNVYVELQRHFQRGEERYLNAAVDLARAERLPILATNGVLYAYQEQRDVLDVFACARNHTHLDAAGRLLAANDERHLKSAAQMAQLFADLPEAIVETVRLAERLEFTLQNLGYRFPTFSKTNGETEAGMLRRLVWSGARDRYKKIGAKVRQQLERELALIEKLGFCGYFLCIWDIVQFAEEQKILIQGRGSAANSAVCYALRITACDPIENKLLFERFLTEDRTSWPDIDLDLPSGDRRERVIQEVYQRYGKHGAAMTANVITFRGRSAMREIGKALNFTPDVLGRFSSLFGNGDFPHTLDLSAQLTIAGIDRDHPRAPAAVDLYRKIHGLPRHLGQHSGGMIICQGQLNSIMPLENASMPGRVVAQWDKDDCHELGIIKVDLLGLGMMAAMQDAVEICAQRGRPVDLAHLPMKDAATYEMMQRADTIGLFQIESRAQMATLPRLKPERFYDVVIQVAIVRPGPIQGDMVNPYLARRCGEQEPECFHDDLKDTLERTLGVPLFQEQMLRMAMIMAEFSGVEAEELRRALSFHRSHTRMIKVCAKLRERMEAKGHPPELIERIVKSIEAFAVYGFPESHAISFALIAYASAWLKMYRGAEFYTGLLNNQPMGFYSSATLIKDAQRRGLHFLPVSVAESAWICTVVDDKTVRLGFCVVNGLRQEYGEQIVATRKQREFASVADLLHRVRLPKPAQRVLAKLGAFQRLSEHRRDALWQVEAPDESDSLFADLAMREAPPASPLPAMNQWERMSADYAGMNLTAGPHPMRLLRERVPEAWRAGDLPQAKHGTWVQIAGQVICRQRPGTAKGFVFISLEDETGVANAIVVPDLFESRRLLITSEKFLIIEGWVQNLKNVIHVKAYRIAPLIESELQLADSHDFH